LGSQRFHDFVLEKLEFFVKASGKAATMKKKIIATREQFSLLLPCQPSTSEMSQ